MLRPLVLLLAGAAASRSSAFLLPSPASSPSSSRIPAPLPAFLAPWSSPSATTGIKTPRALVQKEDCLLEAIQGLDRREIQNSAEARARVKSLIDDLEASKGIKKATATKEINGKWRLLYTSSDGTASPIQNTFVGSKAFAIYQEIDIAPPSSSSSSLSSPATVTNIVDFGGSIGALNVQALASTPFRPISGFEPRKGDGKLFGINVLGVSKTEVPRDGDPADRIDFKFDNAGFDLGFLPFRVPYPVPFRLLGDEVKGWLEVTYLSPRLRLSRGNKGTIFVLQKVE